MFVNRHAQGKGHTESGIDGEKNYNLRALKRHVVTDLND